MAIQILSPQLANQIAAGEVVERPASVVKELVENSLDAGATVIDIEIERGGAKLIRIRDNGCGIGQEDLALALARHATSKIVTLDDLEAIISLGFRGEALASISSVSRLTLTSRPENQTEAWQVYAEGRNMDIIIKPAAHPVGTTIEVLDLFYNTPARRKFLRTEKTEFNHIDEVVRRIALARFDVAINLHHNGKLVRQYRAVKAGTTSDRRLISVCGEAFVKHALNISWQHGDLNIHGWIADPAGAQAITDLQYCYVNGRVMRDRLLNHAIRQAYQSQLVGEQQPAYVLYLEVDPREVDVNVHPAKHEVRFHQSRLVHDFIYQAVITALQEAGSNSLLASSPSTEQEEVIKLSANWLPENRVAAGKNTFSPNHAKENKAYWQLLQTEPVVSDNSQVKQKPVLFPEKYHESPQIQQVTDQDGYAFGRVLTIYQDCYAIIERRQALALLALPVAEYHLFHFRLLYQVQNRDIEALLIPLVLTLNAKEQQSYLQNQLLLSSLCIDVTLARSKAKLNAVPLLLRQQNLQRLLPELLDYLSQGEALTLEQAADWLAKKLCGQQTVWNQAQAIQLLAELERIAPDLIKSSSNNLIQPINLQPAIQALKHE